MSRWRMQNSISILYVALYPAYSVLALVRLCAGAGAVHVT